jgi:PAS domain S-box-containing protein
MVPRLSSSPGTIVNVSWIGHILVFSGIENPKILLVDGNRDHVDIVRSVFKSCKPPVDIGVALTLREARDTLEKSAFDLVIASVYLVDGSGADLLPADLNNREYPLILTNGQKGEEAAVKAIKAGAVDYVVKSYAAFAKMPIIAERALRFWYQVVERTQAEGKLRESEEKYRYLFEGTNIANVIIGLDGSIIDTSESFVKRLGYSKGDVIGKNVLDFVVPKHTRKVLSLLEKDFRGEYTDETDIDIYSNSGSVRKILFAPGVVTLYENTEAYAVLASGVDITEHLQAKETIEDLKRTKNNLTDLIVHDIKNVTLAMLAWLEMMRDGVLGPLTKDQTEALRRVIGSNKELCNLSEEILDIAMSEKGSFTLEKEPYPLEEQIYEIINYYLPFATKGGRELLFDCPDRSVFVYADKGRIKRVVANLIDNALKFTQPDHGKVEVSIIKMEREGTAVLEVSDNGPGVPEEFREKIFEKFYQVDLNEAGLKRGNGLGLKFCKMIVEAHGGDINVECSERIGSVFRFTIPLYEPNR